MKKVFYYIFLISILVNIWFIYGKNFINNNRFCQNLLHIFDKPIKDTIYISKDTVNIKSFKILNPLAHMYLTSKFGYRIHPISNKKTFHNGIDLYSNYGDFIYAQDSGIVVDTYTNSSGGNQVIIKYPKLTMIIGYAHLQNILVMKEQKVNKGDIIGTVGSTGNSTGSHLHLTIRSSIDNGYLNPIDYITLDKINNNLLKNYLNSYNSTEN